MENDKPQTPTPTIQVDVLREIGTPLKYFALAILIVNGVLGALVLKATGRDFTLLVVGMIGTLVLLIAVVGFLAAKRPEALLGVSSKGIPKVATKHDVFLSSPMAAFDRPRRSRGGAVFSVGRADDGGRAAPPTRRWLERGAIAPAGKDSARGPRP